MRERGERHAHVEPGSRNGQTVTSGVYIFSVEPDDGRFPKSVGKFVVIR